jgi:hypothetical protein
MCLVYTLRLGNLDFSTLDLNLETLLIISTKFVSLAIFLEILKLACKELWLLKMSMLFKHTLLGFAFLENMFPRQLVS